jgi:DNA-binding MarR family transcriptional regulator
MSKNIERKVYEISLRMRLLRALLQKLDREPEDISELEILILEALEENTLMSISQIEAITDESSMSTISGVISELWKKKGYVCKNINPENERERIIELTPEGKQKLEAIKKNRAKSISFLSSAIETEEEMETVDNILDRAIEHLDKKIGELVGNLKKVKEESA